MDVHEREEKMGERGERGEGEREREEEYVT